MKIHKRIITIDGIESVRIILVIKKIHLVLLQKCLYGTLRIAWNRMEFKKTRGGYVKRVFLLSNNRQFSYVAVEHLP